MRWGAHATNVPTSTPVPWQAGAAPPRTRLRRGFGRPAQSPAGLTGSAEAVASAASGEPQAARMRKVRRMSNTHDDLWPGIHLNLDHAKFHLQRMAHALRNPDPRNLALLTASGA